MMGIRWRRNSFVVVAVGRRGTGPGGIGHDVHDVRAVAQLAQVVDPQEAGTEVIDSSPKARSSSMACPNVSWINMPSIVESRMTVGRLRSADGRRQQFHGLSHELWGLIPEV